MEALQLLTSMQWPASIAIVGLAIAVSIPVVVRRTLRRHERIEELKLKRAIQLERFKSGALTHSGELD